MTRFTHWRSARAQATFIQYLFPDLPRGNLSPWWLSRLVLYAWICFISLQQAACTWLPYNALYSMRQWWWREPSDANRIVDASEALIPSHKANFLGSETRIDVHANATEIGNKSCSNQIEIYQVRQRRVLLVFPVSLEKCRLPGSAWLHCKRSILIPLNYFVFQISSASSVYEPWRCVSSRIKVFRRLLVSSGRPRLGLGINGNDC